MQPLAAIFRAASMDSGVAPFRASSLFSDLPISSARAQAKAMPRSGAHAHAVFQHILIYIYHHGVHFPIQKLLGAGHGVSHGAGFGAAQGGNDLVLQNGDQCFGSIHCDSPLQFDLNSFEGAQMRPKHFLSIYSMIRAKPNK